MKVMETMNYDKFELLPFNRPVMRTEKLKKSMQRHGWIDAYPMHCIRNHKNGKLKIKAGHHRFTVARGLGIPVKYIVCNDDATIHELEQSTTKWTAKDYLLSHLREGKNPAYETVNQYHKKTGISVALCVAMLGGETAGSHNKDFAFKEGTYRLGDPEHAQDVADIVLFCKKQCKISWSTNSHFVTALSKIMRVDEFDPQQFKRKVKIFKSLMEKQRTIDDYLRLIESIYNRQSQDKIPLVFFATLAGKKRNPINRR